MDQRHGVLAVILIIAGVLVFYPAGAAIAQGLRGGGGAAPAQSAPSGPVQVGVVTLQHQAVPVTVELPGRVSASQTADVRPQVGGVIKSIDFRAGQQVKQGDVLYEIDSATYDAQVAVAQAAVQKAQAAETNAQTKLTRSTQLAQTNNLSQSDLQDAQLAETQAQADVASANASLDAAKINASLTKVAAPISGLISDTAVTTGALVTAAQATALATIRQLDPSYVDLVETSANLLKLRAQLENGTVKGNGRTPGSTSVHLTLEDGTAYDQSGTLTVADFVVSQSTGTFTIRASFPNPRRLLLPGMFELRATVDLGTEPNGFLVPQRAVTFDASGEATAFFVENGKAVSHVLTTSGTSGNNWVVTAGVADGAQLVVDGLQKISNGSAVIAVPVTLNDQGVAVDAGSSAASPPAASGAPGAGTAASVSSAPSTALAPAAPTPAASSAPSGSAIAPAPASPSAISAPMVEAPTSSASASAP